MLSWDWFQQPFYHNRHEAAQIWRSSCKLISVRDWVIHCTTEHESGLQVILTASSLTRGSMCQTSVSFSQWNCSVALECLLLLLWITVLFKLRAVRMGVREMVSGSWIGRDFGCRIRIHKHSNTETDLGNNSKR